MAAKKRAKYSDWLRANIFKDEKLPAGPTRKPLPEPLRQARALERRGSWEAMERIFLQQARMLENYEDDYYYNGNPVCYHATYQALEDNELRGYFSWRTKVRRGEFNNVPACFLYLYCYELINQIGVANPLDGYGKLLEIKQHYGGNAQGFSFYLNRWMTDYVVYYNLDFALRPDAEDVALEKSLDVLADIQKEPQDTVIAAVKLLSPKWLERSRFYHDQSGEMDVVIYRTLQAISAHYSKGGKRPMLDQYFGNLSAFPYSPFPEAVFSNPLRRKKYEYRVTGQFFYECENNRWFIWRRNISPRSRRKLEQVLKTIDAIMREEYGYGHPIQPEITVKWLHTAIRTEIHKLKSEKLALERSRIDVSQLDKIREDAESIKDRLIVEDEAAPLPEQSARQAELGKGEPDAQESRQENPALTPDEYRLLQCLLYGGSLDWVQEQGLILSVLVDAINEKLYDEFADSVLDDTPNLVEDYIDSLKEIVQP